MAHFLYITTTTLTYQFHNSLTHSLTHFLSLTVGKTYFSGGKMQLSPVIILATLCIVLQLTSSAPVTTNSHASNSHWLPAVATWYGSANGDGSDGKHIIKPHFTLSSDRNVKTFSHYIPEYRRSVWLRYVGRRETVTCEGWSGEPYPLQER